MTIGALVAATIVLALKVYSAFYEWLEEKSANERTKDEQEF